MNGIIQIVNIFGLGVDKCFFCNLATEITNIVK